MLRRSTALFFAIVLMGNTYCAAFASHPKKFVIIKNGTANAVIVVAEKASGDELFAAGELQNYIKKSSGVLIPIKKDSEKVLGNIIAVGRNKINADADIGTNSLAREGFRIKTADKVLSLAGKDDAGTQFAVYSFLEKYLGVRWFWPGELGEVVPQMKTIAVEQIDETEEPDFKWRNRGPGGALWGAHTGPTEMHARELVLGVTREHQKEVELWEKRNKWGGMKIYGGHALGEIFPPEKYAQTHPEYYALVGGKRTVPDENYDYKHDCQVCTTDPNVIKVTAAWVRNFLDEHPDYDGVHVTMNDSGGFCECDKCRALDSGELIKKAGIDAEEMKKKPDKYTVITDRIFTFVNQVAEEVQKTHPGKYVVSMAYSRYTQPPKKIQLNPYVIPQYCLWSAYKHANAKVKKEHEEIAAEWAKAAKRTAIYEYYINGSWPGMHRLFVPYLADSIRELYKQGIELYQMQAGDEFGINGINYYVAGRMLWDTSLDEQKMLDDFYQKAFGRSGEVIKRFHNRLTDAWSKATADGNDVSCSSLKDTRLPELFTPQLLDDCRRDLAEADKAADNDLIRRRIDFYRKGLTFTEQTVDAVRASKKVFDAIKTSKKLKSLDVGLLPADKDNLKKLIEEALSAWEKRNKFVEELKNDYVLAYFWVVYTDYSRDKFYPVADLKELSKSLASR
jgi:hypothetical protein